MPKTNDASLKGELTKLLNYYSVESDSNTPDFILAEYLLECLRAYNHVIASREQWLGPTIEVND